MIGGPFCWGTRTGLMTILIPKEPIPGIIPGIMRGGEDKSKPGFELGTLGCDKKWSPGKPPAILEPEIIKMD